jgi:tryptophan halogenase
LVAKESAVMVKNVLIVGGGTAGWLTALAMRQFFPHINVELIESEEIGVLGAGESTTSSFILLLKGLNIDIHDFVKNTESTIKGGIRFDGWNSPDSFYLSTFHPWHQQWNQLCSTDEVPEYLLYCYVNNIDVNNVASNKIYLENRVPILGKSESIINGPVINGDDGGYTFHINAKLTSKYLRKVAEKRGVIRHEGKVVKINGHYPIKSVEDDKGRTHNADFFFDCSGFARLFLGKHFNVKWIDYTKHLTVDSTIPFFLPLEETYPAYTHAIAMKYGWMFRVPTQKRYGSGYIYDSNLISKEDAIKEVQEKLGHEVELVNFFHFKSGIFEKTKISNCIGFGLSSGFLEPMAATNISSVCSALIVLKSLLSFDALVHVPRDEQRFNAGMRSTIEYSGMTEIFSHYVNSRNDTEFWRYYKNIENFPPIFRKAYEECFSGERFEIRQFSEMTRFDVHTFITKLIGNEWFREKALKYYEKYNLERIYKPKFISYKNYIDRVCPNLPDHRTYLESL